MFTHYLTIAFRNLTKYRIQTIISIIGLAVGFVCFALSALWIRYERSFDSFHPNARNMYMITLPDAHSPHGFSARRTQPPLAAYLKSTFPEVKNATYVTGGGQFSTIHWNGVEMKVSSLMALDHSFLDLFNIRILEGHFYPGTVEAPNIAISASKARKLFGDESPIGQIFEPFGDNIRITAIVSDLARPSNFQFDFINLLGAMLFTGGWASSGGNTLIELHPNVDKGAFFNRLRNHTIRGETQWGDIVTVTDIDVIPLTRMRYQYPNVQRNVQYEYILLFSLVGLLVILCSLFNYFTLFFSRFRIRKREFSLRMVFGATSKSLFSLLATEFLAIMLLASVLGLMLINLFQPVFLALSEIDLPLSAIFGEVLLYWLGVILLALLSFFVLLLIFKKRSLNASIRRSKNAISRKISIVVQLVISIIFAFCTIVMMKQLNDLTRSGNLGFEFHNTAALLLTGDNLPDAMELHHQLIQMPEMYEVLIGLPPLMPQWGLFYSVGSWDGKRPNDEAFDMQIVIVSEAYMDFYRFQLVKGELLTDCLPENIAMINEEAKRRFGWTGAIGKTFQGFRTVHTVQGVVRNKIQNSPALPATPTVYFVNREAQQNNFILFRYQGVPFSDVQRRINAFFAEEYPHLHIANLFDAEITFAEFIQSERSLMKLLGFVSLICILISIFGFFSLVSLTCEERRKEIAIRKINGATIHDIVGIFFKEYSLLLAIGALIAFPIGYYIMQRWLEQYVIQTGIDAWIYVTILLALTLVIILCVGWRVWKASIENPADVVKSE